MTDDERVITRTLDVVVNEGEDLTTVIVGLIGGLDVSAMTLSEQGPGGGWPVVMFTGRLDHMRVLLKRYYGEDGPWPTADDER